jgi:hypothetical protein
MVIIKEWGWFARLIRRAPRTKGAEDKKPALLVRRERQKADTNFTD